MSQPPAVYVTTVYAQPGKEEAVSRAYVELGRLLEGAPGYRGRHVLRSLPTPPPAPDALHGDRPQEAPGPEGVHFVSVEIWESREARQAHRATAEFLDWYRSFTQNLLPAHTHGWYEDISALAATH